MHGAANPTQTQANAFDLGVDRSFLRRVHLTGVVLSLLGAFFLAAYQSTAFALGFLCMSMWSIANLWTLERLMREVLRPEGRSAPHILVALAVKLPVLYALLVVLLMKTSFPAASLLIGLSVPLAVIVLKVASIVLMPRLSSSGSHRRGDPS